MISVDGHYGYNRSDINLQENNVKGEMKMREFLRLMLICFVSSAGYASVMLHQKVVPCENLHGNWAGIMKVRDNLGTPIGSLHVIASGKVDLYNNVLMTVVLDEKNHVFMHLEGECLDSRISLKGASITLSGNIIGNEMILEGDNVGNSVQLKLIAARSKAHRTQI